LLSVRPPSASQALAWLLRGYLHSYGPARPRDFAKWLAGPLRWAEQLFAELASELSKVEFADAAAYVVKTDTKLAADPADSVRLLPYFDSFVVGSHPRELLFPGQAADRALSPSGQAGNYPTLLIDGEVAGVWHAKRSGSSIAITVEPLRQLTKKQRALLDDEVDRIGAISEAKPNLTIGTVSVGGHA
jgi:winged helix DNA-binding protein